jgi:prepilin-type N-terminal cleavage/methylation domain-containing protein
VKRRHPTFRAGFTLIEVLMAVAIMASLLTATAMALKASIDAYAGNNAGADMLQHSRNAMLRMSAELRTGYDFLPTTVSKQTLFATGDTVTDTGITFKNEAGTTLVFSYDSTAKTLNLKVGTATAAVLARGVDDFNVRLVPMRSKQSVKTGGIYDELERVSLTLQLHSLAPDAPAGTLTLTQSVTPRARLWE